MTTIEFYSNTMSLYCRAYKPQLNSLNLMSYLSLIIQQIVLAIKQLLVFI